MSNANEEAAVNAMAAQVVYGDDELREDMKVFIVEAFMEVLREGEIPNLPNVLAQAILPNLAPMLLTNYAREIEKIVARYLTNKLQVDQY
jgi:hypothetical protein